MCGIVGAIARRAVATSLIEGLKRLEYRGYDSAGIAVMSDNASILRQRTQGKVRELESHLQPNMLVAHMGIAHTRWATHGEPVEMNAHPHMSGDDIALVHNGIIENHDKLRKWLTEKGYVFHSETDSEIVAHLVHFHKASGLNLLDAVYAASKQLSGAFALGIIDAKEPNRLIAIRHGSPLVIGLGDDENFIASDHIALIPEVSRFIYLEEGDMAELCFDKITIYDENKNVVTREIHHPELHFSSADKGQYRHYMLKEIYDQPEAIAATIEGRFANNHLLLDSFGAKAKTVFAECDHIQIVACGTSYHAGVVAKYWFEELAKIPCSVEIASEFRYRSTVVQPNTLFVTISQSGETADTLAALRQAKTRDYLASIAICNMPESSLVRESDMVLMTRAGLEIGVASTKAFTTQLTALLLLVIGVGRFHGMTNATETQLLDDLRKLPTIIANTLALNENIQELAQRFADKEHALFLGRGVQYPIAMEGALKLKEISYIHAEAYPAGELKHGPLALVDKEMPVVAVAPNNALLEKLKSNLHEVRARGGKLYVFADSSAEIQAEDGVTILAMPSVSDAVAPIIYTIPLQLLAYHVAVLKGTDVDQPRNLAKSVTVE